MRTETTRLFTEMLGLQGYRLQAPDAEPTAGADATDKAFQSPPSPEPTMNLFKSFWLLGGLQSIDSRIDEDEQPPFGPTYGNRVASERAFGPQKQAHTPDPADLAEARVAHC